MKFLPTLALSFLAVATVASADDQWITYEGKDGPGKGKRVVLIAGDEEYRSEEALPMLGKLLSQRHGFTCTVLFPINKESGEIDPNTSDNLPGAEALDKADLVITSLPPLARRAVQALRRLCEGWQAGDRAAHEHARIFRTEG